MDEILKTPQIIILSGPPRSGKSFCIQYMISKFFELNKNAWIYVISPTLFNGTYDNINQKLRTDTFKEETINKLLEIQKKQIDKPLLLVFDDCAGENFNTPMIKKLITCHRHYNITTLFGIQYAYNIPPTIRTCAGYCLAYHTPNKKNNEALYESYGGAVEDFGQFNDLIKSNTGDFFCLLINVQDNTFFKYKCPSNYKKINIGIGLSEN